MKKIFPRFIIAALVVAAIVLFGNLGNIYLWQDECSTALIAQNTLTLGYPSAWDGKNIITQNEGRDSNDAHVWTWSVWLEFYMVAISFFLFGANAFSARLPFVLAGLASIVIFYPLLCRVARDEETRRLAVVLLVCSIPFLLHARQCRYYSLCIFATIWITHAYLKMQAGEKFAILSFSAAAILFFYSSFAAFFGVMGGIMSYYLLSHIFKLPKPKFKKLAVSLAVIVGFTLPWFLYAHGWSRVNPYESDAFAGMPLIPRILNSLRIYLAYINTYFFPLIFIPLLLLLRKLHKKPPQKRSKTSMNEKKSESEHQAIFLIITMVVFQILFVSCFPWVYFRYLIGLVPLCCILAGMAVREIIRFNRAAGYVSLSLLLFTNIFSLMIPFQKSVLRFDLLNYIYEITHDYDGPMEGIVKFLKSNGHAGQTVVTNYGQLPIIFYTGMKAFGFGQDITAIPHPDWVIIRRHYGAKEYLSRLVRRYRYKKTTLNYPDIPCENRPDPFYHQYRTVKSKNRISVYRKI